MNRVRGIAILIAILVLIDLYVYQAAVAITRDWSGQWKNVIRYGYWGLAMLSWTAVLWFAFGNPFPNTRFPVRTFITVAVVAIYLSKIFSVVFVLIDDLQRGVRVVVRWFSPGPGGNAGTPIPRSEFLAKTAAVAATVPFGLMTYGILSGAHDYRVRKVTLTLPNLPKFFDGIRIGQISDIHSGSFFNKKAVNGGVEMFLGQKPDIIFFTGDLVNNQSSEIREYFDVFNKLKAPLGVFSITGNHDYGDYRDWNTVEEKKKNFRDLIEAHRLMGYDLLLNEHRFIELQGEKIAIIGVENWGTGRFSKYGKLDEAYAGTEEAPVKFLLSHDPTHWDAQVRPLHPDIDVMFAGHTHGFQFGVEIGKIKWSPVQYVYKQWGGLYQEQDQRLYVNRGFGFIGYPGRIGMPPELTIFELKR
jgi:predicted MPP superfamily phosphohydrolase